MEIIQRNISLTACIHGSCVMKEAMSVRKTPDMNYFHRRVLAGFSRTLNFFSLSVSISVSLSAISYRNQIPTLFWQFILYH